MSIEQAHRLQPGDYLFDPADQEFGRVTDIFGKTVTVKWQQSGEGVCGQSGDTLIRCLPLEKPLVEALGVDAIV